MAWINNFPSELRVTEKEINFYFHFHFAAGRFEEQNQQSVIR